jgi:toxin FitB
MYLLDTCVVSEIQRPRPDEGVREWLDGIDGADLFLSVVTLGEIAQGIEKVRAKDEGKAHALERWLTQLRVRFAQRLIPIDDVIADQWGRLNGRSLASGQQRPLSDHLLAATALVRGMVLVTRNTRDFTHTPVVLLNPWRSV